MTYGSCLCSCCLHTDIIYCTDAPTEACQLFITVGFRCLFISWHLRCLHDFDTRWHRRCFHLVDGSPVFGCYPSTVSTACLKTNKFNLTTDKSAAYRPWSENQLFERLQDYACTLTDFNSFVFSCLVHIQGHYSLSPSDLTPTATQQRLTCKQHWRFFFLLKTESKIFEKCGGMLWQIKQTTLISKSLHR